MRQMTDRQKVCQIATMPFGLTPQNTKRTVGDLAAFISFHKVFYYYNVGLQYEIRQEVRRVACAFAWFQSYFHSGFGFARLAVVRRASLYCPAPLYGVASFYIHANNTRRRLWGPAVTSCRRPSGRRVLPCLLRRSLRCPCSKSVLKLVILLDTRQLGAKLVTLDSILIECSKQFVQ